MNKLNIIVCSFELSPSDLVKKILKLEKKYNFKSQGLIVSNSKSTEIIINNKDWQIIHGSNKYLDFSAYFEGTSHYLESSKEEIDSVIFINDSFFTKHNSNYEFKMLLKNFELLKDINDPVIIGKGSRYHSICHKNPWSDLNIFIPSYCFAVNKRGLDILSSLETCLEKDGYAGNIEADIFSSNIDKPFYNLLLSSVKSNVSPYKWDLGKNKINNELLEKKAICIYFEHRLSGEIGSQGCIIPTNAGNKEYLISIFREAIYRTASIFKWKK